MGIHLVYAFKIPSEWEKIIAKETTVKELISKIYKQLTDMF